MAKQFRVLRHFRVNGAMRKPGDLLDAADVKNNQALVDQRYIVAADDDTASSNQGGPTPDPKIAQDRMVEQAAGRQGGPENDVADDDKVTARTLKGKLPEDFPGHTKLTDAGFTTYAKVRKELDAEKPFAEVDGVGPKSVKAMRAIFGDTSADESADDDTASEAEPGDSTVPKAANAGG